MKIILLLKKSISGFTLLELMISVAIAGILTVIAVPNFISYRNKTYCTVAERNVEQLKSTILNYFAIPSHNNMILPVSITGNQHNNSRTTINGIDWPQLSFSNTGTIEGVDPNVNITITITDGTGRCPQNYRDRVEGWSSNGYYISNIR